MKYVLKAYTKPGAVLDMVSFKSVLGKATQNEKNFLEHLVGGLDISSDSLEKKLKQLNTYCSDLEICLILSKLESNWENCLNQMVRFDHQTTRHKRFFDPEIKQICKEMKSSLLKSRLEKKIIEKEKMVFEMISFLVNLTRQRTTGEMDLIDRMLTIISMYFIPSVYKYLFMEFIPSLMKDAKSFDYDSLLVMIQKLLNKLISHFENSNINYSNLYPPFYEDTVLKLRSKLFSTIYSNKQQFVGDGSMMKELINSSYTQSRTIAITSPSLHFNGTYTINLEIECITCIHYIARFLQQFMPVFFIKVNRMENILMIFEIIFRLDFNAVRRMTLNIFCEINLSFLQFWTIWEFYSMPKLAIEEYYEMNKRLKDLFITFSLHYFSWSIYTADCYKEYNTIESIEKILNNLKALYFIHNKIIKIEEDPHTKSLSQHKLLIYGKTFPEDSLLGHKVEVIISRKHNNFSVRKVKGLLAHNSKSRNFLADEIEKIKGFFYTKFKHDDLYPDLLGLSKITSQEFEEDLQALFWLNPLTAFSYSQRLYGEVSKPTLGLVSKTFGPLVERSVEVFLQYKEFLPLFVDYKADHSTDSSTNLDAIMFWEMPFIPDILKYIGQKYDKLPILGNFFSKMMMRINSNQLSFYLSQIFQSLDYSTSNIIEDFVIRYAEDSPLFAHQVIWMARVEEKAELEADLATNQHKRAVAAGLPLKIIKNMGIQEKKFWDEVDSFFEQITKISSVLKPKMEKAEKREIINARLEVIKMPPLVYMPTNPEYRVTRIKLGSGNPLQSAAKCPIWVSFYCKKFEGPDKYFSALKNKKDDKTLLESGFKDIDENVGHVIPDKVNSRSINIKDNFIFKTGVPDTLSEKQKGEIYSKLSNLTEEMYPILSEKKTQPITSGPYSPEVKQSGLNSDSPKRAMGAGLVNQSPMESSLLKPSVLGNSPNLQNNLNKVSPKKEEDEEDEEIVSCIFKTFDDIRRDNLALQIIRIFQEIFMIEKLDLFLFPYKTISTRTGNVDPIYLRKRLSEVSSKWFLELFRETRSERKTNMTFSSTSRSSTALKFRLCTKKLEKTS